MKKNALLTVSLIIVNLAVLAQVGINSDNSEPEPSAMLDVKSTNKGFLPPRVALTAANVASPVTSPVNGLFVFNTTTSGSSPNEVVPGYYCWNGSRWVAVIVPQGTNIGDMIYWNGTQWVQLPSGSNGQVLTLTNGLPVWKQPSFPCGVTITINHTAGTVSPVTKTVSYYTVNNIQGEPSKCWITSNLGADHQATGVNDATESSSGWYFQFNRKQGYKHDGVTLTPSWSISSINENSDWILFNDPCNLELGTQWRLPTYSEWYNVDNNGSWTNWNGPWSSGLKLHCAGFLDLNIGTLNYRGSYGFYWSSKQFDATSARHLYFHSGNSYTTIYSKANGFSVRCLSEN